LHLTQYDETIAKICVISSEDMRSQTNLVDLLTNSLTRGVVPETSRGIELEPMDWGSMMDNYLWQNEAI